jgi:hypothetical protein
VRIRQARREVETEDFLKRGATGSNWIQKLALFNMILIKHQSFSGIETLRHDKTNNFIIFAGIFTEALKIFRQP